MRPVRTSLECRAAIVLVAALASASSVRAQTTTMPSTLRYGSGLLNIPVASVLPHMEITGTYSGFFVSLDRTAEVSASGATTGYGPAKRAFYQDGSVALGLFDRAEFGATVQSLGDSAKGGNVWGLFGRLQLIRPAAQGLALAVGGRYVTGPDFGGGVTYEPTRLGIPDARFRHAWSGLPDIGTKVSLYGVASLHVRGYDGGLLPTNDLTFVLGYGSGMFKEGERLGFYASGSSNGWFFGSAVHVRAGGRSLLTLMGEYDGFDVNLGAQLDVRGLRVGAQYLGANYPEPAGGYASEYRRPKLGILASVAVCPGRRGLFCAPHLTERPSRKVVQLPAPPPDTVVRVVAPSPPEGRPASLCLATGRSVQVLVSERGDTLVGPGRVPLHALGPGVVFEGSYAAESDWYRSGDPVRFEERTYVPSAEEVRLDCGSIARVGESHGIPLFALAGSGRPYATLYVPVRPGVWKAYRMSGAPTRPMARAGAPPPVVLPPFRRAFR